MPINQEDEMKKLLSKFDALGNITRATWYEWREAALSFLPAGTNPTELVLKAWEVVGHDTAKAYFTALDKSKPTFLRDIAKCIVNSSTMMGETAKIVDGKTPDEVYIQWDRCPWPEFARRYGASMEEDVLGCDKWFQTVIADVNELFNTKVKLETLNAIPRGEKVCVRRLSISK